VPGARRACRTGRPGPCSLAWSCGRSGVLRRGLFVRADPATKHLSSVSTNARFHPLLPYRAPSAMTPSTSLNQGTSPVPTPPESPPLRSRGHGHEACLPGAVVHRSPSPDCQTCRIGPAGHAPSAFPANPPQQRPQTAPPGPSTYTRELQAQVAEPAFFFPSLPALTPPAAGASV